MAWAFSPWDWAVVRGQSKVGEGLHLDAEFEGTVFPYMVVAAVRLR